MGQREVIIRKARAEDYDAIVAINADHVALLSPMDRPRLEHLLTLADRCLVADVGGEVAGFAIAFTGGTAYDSGLYGWIESHVDGPHFYLDRVAIDARFQRRGLAGRLYDAMEMVARRHGQMTLEVNLEPPNVASLAFHQARGYLPLGTLTESGKTVQFMAKPCPPATPVHRPNATELIELVLDHDSWTSWDTPPVREGLDPAYADELARAAERSGVDESIVTGQGTLSGRRVAVILGEFGFLAGSIGRASADRIVAAIERATAEGLPLLAAPVSGGTRMQEGTPAFVQMVRISAAVAAHRAAGLPYLVYLRHPTTGGVMASWGSLGHVTVAEPQALVGFLGPRVYEALYGEPFPEGVQTSENLYAHGVIDAVVSSADIKDIVERALRILCPAPDADPVVDDVPRATAEPDAWDSITRSRRADRPGVRRLLKYAAADAIPLNGTGQGESDPGVLLALVRFGSQSCVFLGQDRRGQTQDHPLGPQGLREARRGMRLASELGLPLVTVIDTQGAALSADAENGGLAGEIARSLADLVTLKAPTLCVMLGEGNGGGALAFLPADTVIAAQHAWLSPLPPEGASAIVHRTADQAPAMARAQHVRAQDLLALGVVDRIVPELPDAADEPEEFCHRLGLVLEVELAALAKAGAGTPAVRTQRYLSAAPSSTR